MLGVSKLGGLQNRRKGLEGHEIQLGLDESRWLSREKRWVEARKCQVVLEWSAKRGRKSSPSDVSERLPLGGRVCGGRCFLKNGCVQYEL